MKNVLLKRQRKPNRRAARFVKGTYRRESSATQMFIDLEWLSLEALRVVSCLTFMFKIVLGLVMLKAVQVIRSGRATR